MLWSLLEPGIDELGCRFPLIYTMQTQIHLSVSLINGHAIIDGKTQHKLCTQETGIVALLAVDYSHLAHLFLDIENKRTEMMG